jgi:hypothetical protein
MVISKKGLSALWIIAEAGPTGKDLKDRPLTVDEARPRADRRRTGGGGG